MTEEKCFNITIPEYSVRKAEKSQMVSVQLPRCQPRTEQATYCHNFPQGILLTTMFIRAPQLENDIHGSGDGGKASQNYPLGLGPRSFGSKLILMASKSAVLN